MDRQGEAAAAAVAMVMEVAVPPSIQCGLISKTVPAFFLYYLLIYYSTITQFVSNFCMSYW